MILENYKPNKLILQSLLIATIYVVLGKIGQNLAIEPGNVTPVWPPSGFAFAIFLLIGKRALFGIFLGAFLINTFGFSEKLTTDNSIEIILTGVMIGIGSAIQPFIGYLLLNRLFDYKELVSTVKNYVLFIVIVPIMSLVSSTIGTSSLFLSGLISSDITKEVWLTWWLGDGVGIILFTPFILIWKAIPSIKWNKNTYRLLAVMTLLIFFSFISFSDVFVIDEVSINIYFITWPFLIWIALMHSSHSVTMSILIHSSILVLYTKSGMGPFNLVELNHSLLLLQLFLWVTSSSVMIISALVKERQGTLKDFEDINNKLESKVQKRTSELKKAKLTAEKLARTDILTGLSNRIDFEEKSKDIDLMYRRHSRPYTIAMIDIDHFKLINDTYGHDFGDKVLQSIALTISNISRDVDIKCRLGGEEFVVLMPETTIEMGLNFAERLRKSIESQSIEFLGDSTNVTASIGLSEIIDDSYNCKDVLRNADKAMYEAKRIGRNRVCSS